MRYQHVCVETFAHTLPPHVVTSDDIETQLAPVYERLGLPAGRLELMTGIRERRFFERDVRPSEISGQTAAAALDASGLDRRHVGLLVHGSVCRDQLEPATASAVHHAAGLPNSALVLDVSNACLGLLNGIMLAANMIELGQTRAGVVVGTEDGRALVEGTIDSLLADRSLTRQSIKPAFASLTIGAGSAAVVLCDRKLSRTGRRLLGGAFRAETSSRELCEGGVEPETHGDDRPRMQTDSEALLHAGIELAAETWNETKLALGWRDTDVDKTFTHQVGRQHQKLLFERLGLDPGVDFPTIAFLGNTGAVALPMAVSLGVQRGQLTDGDRVALLGIGSGLNAIMLGVEWHSA